MGAGPVRLARDELLRDAVQVAGWTIVDEEIAAVDERGAEVARVIELVRRIAERVRAAVGVCAVPLVLAGNCNSSLGTVAGLGAQRLGVVWFDAHADFDDPEENVSGFFDVMGLAMLTGRGWSALRATIPGHAPIAERDVVLAGVRDLEAHQRARLERSELEVVPGAIAADSFARAVSRLAERVDRIYLHLDLDAIDAAEAEANEYAAGGGPSLEHLAECVRHACERLPVAGAAITAYDPAVDPRALQAARLLAGEIARGASLA
jgi:arginase